jgi:YegS/Rv2252/BmrU family lipid kinase
LAARRALLIANRHSRTGDRDISAALEVLAAGGITIVERQCERPDEVAEVIRSEGGGVDLAILAGGDGTMNAAAEALLERQLPLGILPTGTGNDLARTLRVPTDLAKAAAAIVAGCERRIDLGRANRKHFFNAASIGLAAEVSRHHTAERKRRLWLLAYVLSMRDAWRTTRSFHARLRCDGRTLRLRALQVTVANGRHYGGGMTVHADAAIDDGRLDVYALKPRRLWRLLLLFPALRFGWLHRSEAALALRGRTVEVETRRSLPVNTDGEITTATPVRFTVLPRALSVFVPAAEQDSGEADDHAVERAADGVE